jgi:hypothetical protein
LSFLVPIDSFNLIDRYFASFVCGTYLLFTAILSINIFIGLISNALQTEAFSTVEARFLLERIEVILNYEWRLSNRKRSQLQEIIHRQCAPLQLNWKEINFDAYGQSRDEQQTKILASFRQTLDKHNSQFDTFRIQIQQKLTDVDTTLGKLRTKGSMASKRSQKVTISPDIGVEANPADSSSTSSLKRTSLDVSSEQLNIRQPLSVPIIVEPNGNDSMIVLDELARLRELLEETLAGQTTRIPSGTRVLPGSTSSIITSRRSTANMISRQQASQANERLLTAEQQEPPTSIQSTDLNQRMTDLQLAVNRLHQDVGAIRNVLERLSPLSTSLILGRSIGRR